MAKNGSKGSRCLVVIPAYNEERSISAVVEGARSVVPDVLVVNDGSTDSTAEILKRLGVPHMEQRHAGKGAALRAGFGYAIKNGFDWVITMDGDGQHATSEIPAFVSALSRNGTDLVIGSRMSDTRAMPFLRKATNRFMSSLISRLSGSSIPDTQCGFRAIRCAVLRKVVLKTSHFETESELLMKAAKEGFRISSIPIATIYNGSKSSINKVTDTARFLRLLWNIRADG